MTGKRITSKNNVIKKFGNTFIYQEKDGVGIILVKFNDEIINTIKFWEDDRLKTLEQFNDAVVCWCDQNIA